MRKLLLSLLAAVLLAVAPAYCEPPIANTQYIEIPSADTTVTLTTGAPYRMLQIWSDGSSADIYVDLNGLAATVGSATCIHIAGGASWQSPPTCNLSISNFHVIGASATGKMTIAAFH